MLWQLAWAAPLSDLDPEDLVDHLRDAAILDVSPEIVGGRVVEPGEYADAVGIVMNAASVNCTGTLVAPNVVITAAHCLDGSPVTHVVVGATNWYDQNIEALAVQNYWIHPTYENAYNGRDIGVILLAEDSSFEPRVIANDCVLDEVQDGTPATIVGYGYTSPDGDWRSSTSMKHVAETLVVDADCSEDVLNGVQSGCQPQLRPDGQIGVGGRLDVDGDGERDGPRDVCFGDSGGPVYVHTKYGTHVMGVVSTAFWGVDDGFPCRDGSIFTRPDSVMDFLENRTGVTLARPTCNEPPQVELETVEVRPGRQERIQLQVIDGDSDDYTVEVLDQGALGQAEGRGRRLFYTARDNTIGADSFVVRVTDNGTADGRPAAYTDVEVEVLISQKGCGCSSGTGPAWLFLPLVLVGLKRR